jgi:hypothetical protein
MVADARFLDRLRLPLEFEPERFAADMANFARADWVAHFVTQNCDGDWSAIPLRGVAGARGADDLFRSEPRRLRGHANA